MHCLRFTSRTEMKLIWDLPTPAKRTGKEYKRVRSDDLYHTARWTRLSRLWRDMHPLCAECQRHGVIREAEVVDHIIPFPVCEDFFDTGNLQSLCSDCNVAKGNRDKKLIQQWKKTNMDSRKG